jgi:hypothetical protein
MVVSYLCASRRCLTSVRGQAVELASSPQQNSTSPCKLNEFEIRLQRFGNRGVESHQSEDVIFQEAASFSRVSSLILRLTYIQTILFALDTMPSNTYINIAVVMSARTISAVSSATAHSLALRHKRLCVES